MGIETLNAMHEGMQAGLMMIIEVIMMIVILFTSVGLAVYLAGVAWLCFKEGGSLRPQVDYPQRRETEAGKARPARRLPLTSQSR